MDCAPEQPLKCDLPFPDLWQSCDSQGMRDGHALLAGPRRQAQTGLGAGSSSHPITARIPAPSTCLWGSDQVCTFETRYLSCYLVSQMSFCV